MGCVRAVDFLFTLDKFDKVRLAVLRRQPQGGMLSIVTASLDDRVKYMVCHYPAFCDVTGYYNGRAGGWPHLFINKNETNIQARINTSKYYETTANFARFYKYSGILFVGIQRSHVLPHFHFFGLQRDKRPETAGTGARCRPLAVPMACQRRSQMAEDTVRNGLTGIYKQKNPPRMERIFLFVIVCPKKRA